MPLLELERLGEPGHRLAGRVAIVTGAGSAGDLTSIGMAVATLFARQGAAVGIVDLSAERAAHTVELIGEVGGKAIAAIGDITRSSDCSRCVAEVVAQLGRLDILVNSAAIVGAGGDAADMAEDVWDRVLAVNLTGTMLMTKHAAPHLRQAPSGAIINISSIAGMRGMGSGPYAASKAGVIGLTYDLAYTLGRDGIRVNCVAPGHLFTPMGYAGNDELRVQRRKAGLLGSEGDAWDAAWATLFLASDESRWITGVVLPVDAGTTSSTPLAVNLLEARRPAP